MKTIRIKMQDATGISYNWTVQRFQNAWNCGGNLKNPRSISGWIYKDHDGCERSVEGNWHDLVAAVKATAENYGFSCTIS